MAERTKSNHYRTGHSPETKKLDSPKQNPKAEERVLKRERSHRLGIAINHIINDIVKNSGLKASFLMS